MDWITPDCSFNFQNQFLWQAVVLTNIGLKRQNSRLSVRKVSICVYVCVYLGVIWCRGLFLFKKKKKKTHISQKSSTNPIRSAGRPQTRPSLVGLLKFRAVWPLSQARSYWQAASSRQPVRYDILSEKLPVTLIPPRIHHHPTALPTPPHPNTVGFEHFRTSE